MKKGIVVPISIFPDIEADPLTTPINTPLALQPGQREAQTISSPRLYPYHDSMTFFSLVKIFFFKFSYAYFCTEY